MYGRYYPRRRPVGELVELVGLAGKESRRVKLLSGGQRRRLDLALALVGDPDLLFLDEPTTGFDPSARRQAWTTIKDLCALGKTVFLTTHFMDEAQALADRVAVMVDGRIVALGTPAEIGGRDTAPTEIDFALPARRRARRPAGARRRATSPRRRRAACAWSRREGAAQRPRAHRLGARARPRAARLRRQPAVAGGRLPSTDREPGGHEPMTAMSETLERPADGAQRAHRRRRPDRVAGRLRAARLLAQPHAGLLLLRDAGHAPAALRRAQQRRPDPGARQHPLRHLLPAGHPGLRDHHHPVREHGRRHRDPARQRAAQAHARHAAAGLGLRGRARRLDRPRLGRHDRRHARPRPRLLRRAPARRGGARPSSSPCCWARRTFAALGHGSRHAHPQRRGRSGRRQRAHPAALLHLGHLVPAHRRAGLARRRGEALPGRAPGQRAARRLRPAQPRLGLVGQRPALARDLAARRARGWRCASGSGRWRAERGPGPGSLQGARGARRGHLRDLHLAARRHRAAGRRAQRRAARGRRPPRSSSSSSSSSRRCAGRMDPEPPAVVARAYVIDLAIAARADRRRPARLEPALLLRRGHGRPAPAAAVERRRPAGDRR